MSFQSRIAESVAIRGGDPKPPVIVHRACVECGVMFSKLASQRALTCSADCARKRKASRAKEVARMRCQLGRSLAK